MRFCRFFALFCFLVLHFPAPSWAQPLDLQIAVAVNDKGLKGYYPYRSALAARLGESFILAHDFIKEGRRPCKWEGDWFECAYLKVGNVSLLGKGEREAIFEVLRDPCLYLSREGVRVVEGRLKKDLLKDYVAFEKIVSDRFHELKGLCAKSIFSAAAVRVVVPDGRHKKDLKYDALEFEVKLVKFN